MKTLFPLLCILLEVCLVSGNRVKNNFGIIASQIPRRSGNYSSALRISSSLTTPSSIKILDNQGQASQQQLHHLPHSNPQPYNPYHRYPESEYPDLTPHKKSGPLTSVLNGFGLLQGVNQENEPEENANNQASRVERHETHEGWGWSKPKKKKGGGGGGSDFSLLDLLLSGLSLVSFGAFLMNLTASLLSILFGSGLFSNTLTYPYYYTSGTGGGTAAVRRIANRIVPYLRGDLKKKHGSGTIQADVGVGNAVQEVGTSGWAGYEPSGEESDFDDDNMADSVEAELPNLTSDRKPWGRTKRSSDWEPTIDAPTSLNIAARGILNSIQSMNSNYQCMEKVVCDSNRHAKVIKRGLEYFMPIYTFSASYFGQKLGLHTNLNGHLRAIILGVQQANCRTNFPQCSHP